MKRLLFEDFIVVIGILSLCVNLPAEAIANGVVGGGVAMEAASSEFDSSECAPEASLLFPACDDFVGNNRPSNRTVVFRGFDDDGDKILYTDTRSQKINDLKSWPFAEICWYFTESWEQFRISGPIDVIDGTGLREKSWFASSIRSRLQYLAPCPGQPVIADEQPSQSPSLDPAIGPVGAFCLLVLDPDQVDYVNLKSNERLIFTSGTGTIVNA